MESMVERVARAMQKARGVMLSGSDPERVRMLIANGDESVWEVLASVAVYAAALNPPTPEG